MHVYKRTFLQIAAVEFFVGKIDIFKTDAGHIYSDDFVIILNIRKNCIHRFFCVRVVFKAKSRSLQYLTVFIKAGNRLFAAFRMAAYI